MRTTAMRTTNAKGREYEQLRKDAAHGSAELKALVEKLNLEWAWCSPDYVISDLIDRGQKLVRAQKARTRPSQAAKWLEELRRPSPGVDFGTSGVIRSSDALSVRRQKDRPVPAPVPEPISEIYGVSTPPSAEMGQARAEHEQRLTRERKRQESEQRGREEARDTAAFTPTTIL